MSIYLTGDTHGEMSIKRLSHIKWDEGKYLTKDDYVIVAGDFSLIFHPEQTPIEKYWLKWLDQKPWTTLFVDGNHENFWKLYQYPVEDKFEGKVGRISDNIYHLRRGEVYIINNKKILTFGGALSIDKVYRMEGISWWAEEIPSYKEMDHCLDNLEKYKYSVDIIIAHTCPFFIVPIVLRFICGFESKEIDPTTKMLEHIVTTTTFENYYCGHWHIDLDYSKYSFVYERILQIA